MVDLDADLSTTSTNGDVTQHTLDLSTPDGWLSDPDRSWPTWIDPDISMNQVRDTWVRAGDTASHASDQRLIIGKIDPDTTTNPGPTRSYLKFYNSIIETNSTNIEVISAEMGLWQYYGQSCSDRRMYVYPVAEAWSDAITWANKPAVVTGNGATNIETNRGASGCGAGWTKVNLTTMAKAWNNGTVDMQGVRLSAGDEDYSSYERRFCSMNPDSATTCSAARRPYLDVTYNTPPVVNGGTTLQTVGGITTATSTVSDPDGGVIRAEFLVQRGTETVFNGFSTSTTAGAQSLTLPAVPNGVYTVRSRAFDGRAFSAWSAPTGHSVNSVAGQSFAVDGVQPTLFSTTNGGSLAAGEERTFEVTLSEDAEVPVNFEADGAVMTVSASSWPVGGAIDVSSEELEGLDAQTVALRPTVAGSGRQSVTTARVDTPTGLVVVKNTSQQALNFEIKSQGFTSKLVQSSGTGAAPLPEGVDALADMPDYVAEQPLNDAISDLYELYADYIDASYVGQSFAPPPAGPLDEQIEDARENVANLAGVPVEEIVPLPGLDGPPPGGASMSAAAAVDKKTAYKLPITHSTQTASNWCGPASVAMAIRAAGGPERSDADNKKMSQTTLASAAYLGTLPKDSTNGTEIGKIPKVLKKWAGIRSKVYPAKTLSLKQFKSHIKTATGGWNQAVVYGTREYMETNSKHYNWHFENFTDPLDHFITGYGYLDSGATVRYADPVGGRWTKKMTGLAESPTDTRTMQASNMLEFIRPWGLVGADVK